MARGGYRPGAGRPRKDRSETTKKIEAVAKALPEAEKAPESGASEDISPLDYLLSVVRDEAATKADRFRAAVAAAPYVHAKPEAVAKGKKEQKAEEAEKAAAGRFAPRRGPRLAVSNE